MKILLLYLMLAFLGLSIIVTIDLLSGMNLPMAFQSIYISFATTTIHEYVIMVIFLSIPFINAITTTLKKRSKASK
jgi:mannose/fructose-specific phosphotransferase system component IIA